MSGVNGSAVFGFKPIQDSLSELVTIRALPGEVVMIMHSASFGLAKFRGSFLAWVDWRLRSFGANMPIGMWSLAFAVSCLCHSACFAQDCNGNGISDQLEVVTGRGFDDNNNSTLDECEQSAPLPRVRMMSVFVGLEISNGTTTWDTRSGNNFYNLYFQRSGWSGFVNGSYGLDSAEISLRPGVNNLYFLMQRDGVGGESALSLWFAETVVPSITVISGSPARPYGGTINSPYSGYFATGANQGWALQGEWLVRVSAYSGLVATGDVVGYNGLGPNGAADYAANATIEVLHDGDRDRIPDTEDNCLRIFNPNQADCNQDGVGDACELSAGAPDLNNDGVPDTCQCMGDITGDGLVDGADLSAVISNWGLATSDPLSRAADRNSNGRIDGTDLGIVLMSWGPCSI
jgi:hypothetical protein